jgi:hypothetical protein
MIAGWLRRPEAWTFFILLASYAWFWHGRDWNSASRLMLTYAIVDRGTIVIDGLDDQTRDIAVYRGRHYTDKMPGFSVLGIAPYAATKWTLGLPAHPLGAKGFAYWPADYWVTLGVSGVFSAATGALLARLARWMGCGPRASALVGLGYGLATPAYVYATMSYGHQPAAFALLASFLILRGVLGNAGATWMATAGFLAAYASVIELQVGPVSAILGLDLVVQVVARRRKVGALFAFGAGALFPTLLLLGYNAAAFGSPFDMGYFHLITEQFAKVHSKQNPLGLTQPDWSVAPKLLWGPTRGIFRTAPVLILATPGLVLLIRRRAWAWLITPTLVCLAVFWMNMSYPEWTGGWSTGPRLLTPLLPFAMIPVAALLAWGNRGWTWAAAGLALLGAVIVFLYQGVGGRIPNPIENPFLDGVWPLWSGGPVPPWAFHGRFEKTVLDLLAPGWLAGVPERDRWVAFAPLVAFQVISIALMARLVREPVVQAANVRESRTSASIG